MTRLIRIGNAQAFWGDRSDAPARLLKQQSDLDFLTLDYLAEVSLSILAMQREKDPTAGYARDFIDVVRSLTPFWKRGGKARVVTNAGGLNPEGCARACRAILQSAGCNRLKIAIVTGDDVLPVIRQSGPFASFNHLESDASVATVFDRLVTANAYLGASRIAEALHAGADIVITGRVADPSLTVGPCIAAFGWRSDQYDRLAGATVAGHLIECGTQVTGGFSTDWLDLPGLTEIGFPVVEINGDGDCVVTKPAGSGGSVNLRTVKEQLLYEIGDPGNYLSPDVIVSFLTLSVEQVGKDRVCVKGASGRPPGSFYKVSATYRDGFKAHGTLTIYGREAVRKARQCARSVLDRLQKAGCKPERSLVECLGTGAAAAGLGNRVAESELIETVLRISVADSRRNVVEQFSKEMMPLITAGPQGVTGYAAGRPKVQPVFGYWPCLVERERVKPVWRMMDAAEGGGL